MYKTLSFKQSTLSLLHSAHKLIQIMSRGHAECHSNLDSARASGWSYVSNATQNACEK